MQANYRLIKILGPALLSVELSMLMKNSSSILLSKVEYVFKKYTVINVTK